MTSSPEAGRLFVGFIKTGACTPVADGMVEFLRRLGCKKPEFPSFGRHEKLEQPTIQGWNSRRGIAGAILAPAENIGRGLSVRGGTYLHQEKEL